MSERLFADIQRRFEAEQRTSRLGRRYQEWRSEHPPLEPFGDLDALVDFFRDQSNPYPAKDQIAGLLCALSSEDELAELLLLKLYVPGLIVKRRRLLGLGLTQDELDAALVAGFRGRAARTDLGTEMLSGRLLRAARGRAWREIEERADLYALEAPTADEEEFERAGAVADPAEEALGGNEASDLIQQAESGGALRPEHAEILRLIHVEELSNKEAAERIGVEPGTAGVRLFRARASLRRWLRERPRPQEGI